MLKRAFALGLVLLAGCAPKTAKPDPAALALERALAAAARAEAKVLEGCYNCLTEARETYAGLLSGPLAESVRPRHFEAALLVALREKELGLPFEESLARARAAGEGLAAPTDSARLLAIVDAIPPELEGIGALPYAQFRQARLPFAKLVPSELTWLEGAPLQPFVRTYLALALRCEIPGNLGDQRILADEADQPRVLAYRRAICNGARALDRLETFRSAEPSYTEINYFIARAMANRLVMGVSWQVFRERLAAAIEAFPSSTAVNYTVGRGQQLLGNCRGAVELYERTIALTPRHEDAWLGRTMCLSFLGQPEQSIQAATSLIDLNSPTYLRDGYYWRAANHHHLKDLTAARSDIENAKRRGSTIEIMTLAGIIEYEEDALEDAQRDLERAQRMSEVACAPTWYLGLVHIKRGAWSDAGSSFDRAVTCYLRSAEEASTKLAGLETASEIDPEYKQQQIATLKAAITEYTRQRRASAINAAMCLTNSGDLSKNETLIAIASEDPELSPEIERLRAHIKEHYADKK